MQYPKYTIYSYTNFLQHFPIAFTFVSIISAVIIFLTKMAAPYMYYVY